MATQRVLELSMESLNGSISTGVVGGCPDSLAAQQVAQFLEQVTLELPSLIGGY